MIKHFIALIMAGLCGITCVQADDTVIVAGAHWPGFAAPDGSGVYLEKIRARFPAEVELRWDVSEFVRARRLFLAGRADVLVGVYRTTYPEHLYPSEPIDIENRLCAYYLSDNTDIPTLDTLHDRRIAWRNGYAFEDLIPGYRSHLAYENPANAFALLERGKLDVIVDYEHNVPEHLKSQLGALTLLPSEPLWLVFQNTERGRRLLALYDNATQ
ncbi:hypothetical protein [Alteromonas sp. CYL-A6]|uniref:hypothetical protein n=1 Tax=Alteromonas nitratireducens TaxID=3390813 RepID=UPI0034AD6D3D